MKKNIVAVVMLCSGLCAATVLAAPGEYWEVTSKVEMAGMPMAMPETTNKICIPAGKENDPQNTAADKNCEITDIKTAGNTTTWKMRCNQDGEIMTGEGENTSTGNAYQGKVHMFGKMEGRQMDMTTIYRGRKIGGTCDTGTLPPEAAQAKNQAEQFCDPSRHPGEQLVHMADSFLGKQPACAGRQAQYCGVLRAEAASKKETYAALVQFDGQRPANAKVTTLCAIDMEAARQALCSANRDSDYSFLERNCPAEAKAYLEAQRQQQTGRSYTGSPTPSSGQTATGTAPAPGPGEAAAGKPPSQGGAADSVLEGAKKLKKAFGF